MIAAEDPRHASNKGYVAGCREECCRTAHADYRRDLRTRQYLHGGALTVDGLGTRRRLQALVALGWSLHTVDRRLGRKVTYCHNLISRGGDVLASTAEAIATIYDELCMTLPPTDTVHQRQIVTRQKNVARRNGWAPPLAWDDIDRDPRPVPLPRLVGAWEDKVDDAVVWRFVNSGERIRKLTRAEAAEAARVLIARGISTWELEHRYGLNAARYQATQQEAS